MVSEYVGECCAESGSWGSYGLLVLGCGVARYLNVASGEAPQGLFRLGVHYVGVYYPAAYVDHFVGAAVDVSEGRSEGEFTFKGYSYGGAGWEKAGGQSLRGAAFRGGGVVPRLRESWNAVHSE